ncbi:TetR family transcriptional regulator [Sphingobium phenoxybenzoativorans]|uniref:TetR family transcriptional regulator n=1 Tax=Sphingobium phenoxybenzoativorans TaxID=1592790 RepID=A0A975Q2Z5_9SPHN|nr:TetR/AcrR family transcriptional regulator [Sphingobium phenoxybenzoativorans]QUT07196.1 TetR family transcriptional regulator [Sphingobium phenoxybenzoativorans]
MNIDHHAKIAHQVEDPSGYLGDEVRQVSADASPKRKVRKAKTSDHPVTAKKRAPQKRAIEARKRILKAALDCFGAYGFEGTSTRTVAQRAGVTHTLVLYYFNSKDDLWLAMMEDALGTYSAVLAENLDDRSGKSAAERLGVFIEQFVRLSADMPQIHRIMTMEGNQDTDRLEWVINRYLRDHFSRVKDLIKKGQEEGSVRDCDASRLYYFIIGAGGTPFTLSTEYGAITGRDVFSEPEILRNIAFLYELVFI